eukprot:scaffold7932_cov112-Isochrysis_galbana.AAC.4
MILPHLPPPFLPSFELLQNAVDEGATTVSLQLCTGAGSGGGGGGGCCTGDSIFGLGGGAASNGPCLVFSHDGSCFSALDVNGLASVGMSTKAAKRAVGFMGVGFKACHKRWGIGLCPEH